MGFGSSKSQSNTNSQQTSASLNQSYPFLQGALGGQVDQSNRSSGLIANLLGLNGGDAQNSGFDTFRNSGAYKFEQGQGIDAINSNNASKGLLGSGSALKSITNFSSGLASKYLDSYLSSLQGLTNSGLQAGQILSGAGNTANSQGTSVTNSSGKSSQFSLG